MKVDYIQINIKIGFILVNKKKVIIKYCYSGAKKC